jgi:glyoxylase-like metal-dependent hydrolase (beta-lactamase superfamily II)
VSRIAYTRGLHELGDGLYAYLQPDGGWGWSNAGLIAADGTSLIVDTLFDLRLTRDMLEAMRPVTERSPIGQAMNTHGNGDHWFGNQLLPDNIPIVASAPALEEMRATGPQLVHVLFNQLDLGPEFEAFAERTMRRFDFASVEARLPTESFAGSHELRVGDRAVQLVELGPAHTAGDSIAYVPDAATVFTGDLLFIEGTPMIWAGPVSNWLAACDRILELDALPALRPRRGRQALPGRDDRRGGRRRHRHLRLPRLGRPRTDRGQRGYGLSGARPVAAGLAAARAVRAHGPLERPALAA